MRPIRILLVEDNAGDVTLTRKALDKRGLPYHLDVACDGDEAVAMLQRQPPYEQANRPDIIVLDLNLPKRPGREVLREVKSDAELRRIPVIVLTSSEAEQDILESYDLHANSYVTKPMGMEEYRKVVQAIEDYWREIVRLPDA